ncbi:MAG: hypothetical protein ACXIUL_09375 [Wenzhouxiangella sp.]
MISTRLSIWWAFQWLLVFLLLQFALLAGISLIAPPKNHLHLTYYAGQSSCEDVARRLHANNAHGALFQVAPLDKPVGGQLCSLHLLNAPSLSDIGDENRALLQGLERPEQTSGYLNSELSVTPALGRWQDRIVTALALLGSLLWLWRNRLRHHNRQHAPDNFGQTA